MGLDPPISKNRRWTLNKFGHPMWLPKIFFGTRTHKQIAQIVRELAKTSYRDVRLCILASREQTCIDPEVSRMSNKTEECKVKREKAGCRFFDNVRKVTHRNLEQNGLEFSWDLEDFIGFNRAHQSCPYFGARQLREGADIVFCPYNYLIDPVIRDQMQIYLKGDVVILDEAHNMEDAAREAASFSVTEPELETAIADTNRVISACVLEEQHYRLRNVLEALGNWVVNWKSALSKDDYDTASKVWDGVDMVSQLKLSKIGPENLQALRNDLDKVLEEDPQNPAITKITIQTAIILEKTFYMLDFIYRDNFKFMHDYRIALTRITTYQKEKTNAQWLSKKRMPQSKQVWLHTLHFWCMNPAVAFSDLANVRSIILTSGTLSPMTSFQSELAQPFPIQLEANHVINAKQVWVGAVSKGPRGGSLLGTFQNAETFTYQDEIGALVLNVCKTVPHGVLCFLSSYRMLDKLITRWQTTGLYNEITQYKVVMREPRGADRDKVDFDELLREFYAVIKSTEDVDMSSGDQTGAFFMAVCRGKVSEGMDFADNNARAVITPREKETHPGPAISIISSQQEDVCEQLQQFFYINYKTNQVGIPFPNVKDTQVGLKRMYNNEHRHARGLLSGSAWYEIQAYRAINQALGRCIRHRYDWGALILVDERFGTNPAKYSKGLSKWVRNKVQYHGNFHQAVRSLQEFTENMTCCPPGPGQDPTLSVSQMDLSVAVETNYVPGSPLPPVLPSLPTTTASPPMDLERVPHGGATSQHQLNNTIASQQEPTSFLLTSQAGGFLMSQNKDGGVDKSRTSQWQEPGMKVENNLRLGSVSMIDVAMGDTQVAATPFVAKQEELVAGAPLTQPMSMDQTVEFALPLASSTQHYSRPLFSPKFTSTQLGTPTKTLVTKFQPASPMRQMNKANLPTGNLNDTLGLTPIRVPKCGSDKAIHGQYGFEQKNKSVKLKLAKFMRKDKDDDPDYQSDPHTPKCSQIGKKSASSKRSSQWIDSSSIEKGDAFTIDERSNSPLLFGSEDVDDKNSEDFDAVMEHLADATLPREVQTVSEIKNTETLEQNSNGMRPLFKSKLNTVEPELKVGAHSGGDVKTELDCAFKEVITENQENILPSVAQVVIGDNSELKPLLKQSSLSRNSKSDNANKASKCSNPNAVNKTSDEAKANLSIEQSKTQTASAKAMLVNKVKPRSETVRIASKRTVKGVSFISDEEAECEEIITKRASRSKRRRLAPLNAHAPPCDFLDGVTTTEKTEEASLAVCCKNCGIRLTRDLKGVRQEALPAYLSACLPTRDQRWTDPQTATCDQSVTCLKINRAIEAKTSSRIRLNSVWSQEAGCCVCFYRCPSTQCSPRPVAACIIAISTTSKATEGQVWFLPHMTKTSEPT